MSFRGNVSAEIFLVLAGQGGAAVVVSRRFLPRYPGSPNGGGQKDVQSRSGTRPSANDPTSTPCQSRCSKSSVSVSWSTSSSRWLEIRCCIDRLNPQPIPVIQPRTESRSEITTFLPDPGRFRLGSGRIPTRPRLPSLGFFGDLRYELRIRHAHEELGGVMV